MTIPDTVHSHVLAERHGRKWVLHALDFALTVEATTIEAGYRELVAEIRRRLQFAARAGDVMAAFERFEDPDVYTRFRDALLAAQRAALTGAAAGTGARAIAMALPTAADIAAPPQSLADDHKKLDELSAAAKRWAGDDAFKRRRLVAAILE